MTRAAVSCVVLAAALAASSEAATPIMRPLPAECAGDRGDSSPRRAEADAERAWNLHYRVAHEGIERGELDTAFSNICAALADAAAFGPRDWRFAESLDELGLIHFQRGDYERSAAAQATAVAEILLAVGPRPSPETEKACGANAPTYAARLALPLGELGRERDADRIKAAPYRVFTLGLVGVDAAMARRMAWLISEYLVQEDMEAARALQLVSDRALGAPAF